MADEPRPMALRDIVRDASLLAERRKELHNAQVEHYREWVQNREFYKGNQWVYWSNELNRLETLSISDADRPRYKVRLTANQVTPSVTQLVAQMTKTRPTIRATPDSGADRDIKAAEMAERLYEYWWGEFHLKSKLQSALVHAQLSQGYWLITWDAYAGKPFRMMMNPQTGQVITDDELADIYREELTSQAEQAGIDPQMVLSKVEKTVYMGDIDVCVLSGEQVWLDPVCKNFEEASYAICKYPMDVEEIKARYGVSVTPDSMVTDELPSLIYTKGQVDKRPKMARNVYIGYFKKTPSLPKGRYVVWIEDPDTILFQSDWQFPFDELPLVKFPGLEHPNSALDIPRVTFARPLQKELNNTISRVAMFKNLTLKPQMLAPVGSLQQRITDEPGAVFQYAPVQGMAPEWRPVPPLQPYVFEYIADIQRRLDRLFNIMPTERGQLPARTDSGQLVELVQEAVADQLSPEIQRMEESLAKAGMLMAQLAQKFYIEPRLLKISGAGGSVQVKKFRSADLDGGFTFHAEAGSGLPRTRAGQVQQIKELLEMRVISPEDALPYLPIAGLKHIQAKLAADEDFAYRKIEKLIKGEPLNVQAMQQTMQAVQQGMNPKTGHPLQSPEEAQQLLQEAALSPLPYENFQTTFTVLGQHMKSVEFENYPPEVQQRFLSAWSQAYDQYIQLTYRPPLEPIKTTLSLKGTVGPTVGADILQHSGIQSATAETMAEPPLETSVYDSTDKPNVDSEGNHPLDDVERLQALQMAEELQGTKLAKAQADLASSTQKMQQSAQEHALKMAQASDAHQQSVDAAESAHEAKMEQAHQTHHERLRQMRKPKAQARGK